MASWRRRVLRTPATSKRHEQDAIEDSIGLRDVLTTVHRVGCDPCRASPTSHASRTSSGSSCALSSVANTASSAELSDV